MTPSSIALRTFDDAAPKGLTPFRAGIADSLDDRRNWAICASIILLLQAALVLGHQPWLDEWQALQLSLQSPTLADLLENLRYEGHPPLWYLLLRAVGQLAPARWVLALVLLPIAMGVQALILFRLPLGRPERLLVACNAYVLIDYGTISRSLGLGVLLFLAATLLRNRKTMWLAIAALPMVDFLFGVLSLVCAILAWRKKRLWTPGILLWLVVGAAAAWTVRPASDMIPAFWLNGVVLDGVTEIFRFGALLLPLPVSNGELVWDNPPPLAIAVVAGLLFPLLGFRLLRSDRLALFLFGGFLALLLLFSLLVYPLAIRHVSLAALLLIVLVALDRHGASARSSLFALWLAVGAGCGLLLALINLTRPFDTADQAARFIIDHHLEGKRWATFPDSRAQGVSALTGIEFERLERNCTQSFIRWNYRSRIKTAPDLAKELDRIARRGGSFYLLTDFDLAGARVRVPGGYRMLTHIRPGFDGQDYFLWRVRPDLPEQTQSLPQCPPKRLPLRAGEANG